MEIQQLRYFTVAARYQHITKAAEEIHIAQPALTQIIKRLESEVGAPLFERNGRNIILTPEGKILQEEALQILKTIDELPIVLQQKKTERSKTLKIKVSAATIWFMPAIIAYKKTHPDVNLDFIRNDDMRDCDFLITTSTDTGGQAEERFIVDEEILLAVSKDRAKNMPSKVRLSDLKGDVFLITDKSKPFFRICEEYCLKSGFAPNVIFECDSQTVIFDLVSADLGVAFCPTFSWGKIDQNKIALLPFEEKCFRKIVLIALKQTTPLQKDFFVYLKNFMSDAQTSQHK